ncbi:MAG: FxsA family protein [Spirochaetales bacterium]|nr:FxsA family protein [Spirochaetales bacterium]
MNNRFLLKLLDTGFLLKIAFVLLLLSLVFIGEFFVVLFISEFWGAYFTLAVVALTGLAGLFLSFRDVSVIIHLIRDKAGEGEFPEKEMVSLSGAIAGGLLLILPGFITDFLGIISFFPVIKTLYGKIITLKQGGRMHELYEYLKIYE